MEDAKAIFDRPLIPAGLAAASSNSSSSSSPFSSTPTLAPTADTDIATLIDDLRHSDLQVRLHAFTKLGIISHAIGHQRTRDEFVPYLLEFVEDDDEVLSQMSVSILQLSPSHLGGVEHSHLLLSVLQHIAASEETTIRERAVRSMCIVLTQYMTGLQLTPVDDSNLIPPQLNNSNSTANVDNPAPSTPSSSSSSSSFSFSKLDLSSLTKGELGGGVTAADLELQIHEHVLPILRSLATGEWFTCRMSACGLIATIYPRVNLDTKKQLRAMFLKLCGDDMPMVRRAACQQIPALTLVIGEAALLRSDLLPALFKLAKDEQDSVRLLVVQAASALAKQLKAADNITRMLPLLFSLCGDKSWRVRYMVADKFCEICAALGEDGSRSDDLVDGFVHLLQDEEPEVRTAAASRVGETSKLLGVNQTMKKLLHPVEELVKDESQYTRAAIGSVLMTVGSVLKKKEVLDRILPLVVILLKDVSSEVRLNVISSLHSTASVSTDILLSDTLRQSLLPSLADLALDSKWRVRLQLIEQIPALSKQLGHEFFDSKLADLCMAWLGDSVYSIREAATSNLIRLAAVFGSHWARHQILPKIMNLASHKSYLFRMTSLHAIRDLAPIVGDQLTNDKLLPVVVKLVTDPVPNVRFTCARVLGAIWPYCTPLAIQSIVLPNLQRLQQQDTDPDCNHFASLALSDIAFVGADPNKSPIIIAARATETAAANSSSSSSSGSSASSSSSKEDFA